MKTLYDLIGALPDDDAESLREAFRNAVKTTHPDVNSGDPDAPQKFRQVVRANTILSDPEQRAAYDRLLAAAEHPTRAFVADTTRKVAADAVAVVFLTAILVAGYGLYTMFWLDVNVATNTARAVEAANVQGLVKAKFAISPRILDAPGEPDAIGASDSRDKLAGIKLLGDAMRSGPGNAVANLDSSQVIASSDPLPEVPAQDANAYRERGIAAYRKGDLTRALANFDLAIQLDPGMGEAYIDRGIVLYRMKQYDRAFADIAEAKRIANLASLRMPAPPRGAVPASDSK
jgi:curved DNA-binding protein CbpA